MQASTRPKCFKSGELPRLELHRARHGGLLAHLAFLIILGFGYSYFWCASTIIYLLMRQHVDDTDMDEIYIEEDDAEDAYSAPAAPAAPIPTGGSTSLAMVDAPVLKTSHVPAPSGPPATNESAPPDGDDQKTGGP